LKNDVYWMQQALNLASHAESCNEVPVGAVVVYKDQMIGRGWNQPIANVDPTAHAEIIALREAGAHLNNYRLVDTTLYVTLEPCLMCIGAMLHARIKRLVFGACDPKSGAIKSVFNVLDNKQLNHKIVYESDVLAKECAMLLTNFFARRR
jgi:tRNA(adenine34) deaminase